MKSINANTPAQNLIVETDGVKQVVHSTWYRGEHTNFNPTKSMMANQDSVDRYIVDGWAPETPPIDQSTKIVAFGSCFAENITRWLASQDFNVLTSKDGENSDAYVVEFGEGMVNTFAIRQQFEWAFEGTTPAAELWHDYKANEFGYDESIRQKTLDLFNSADVFIITLGLAEIWYDKVTQEAFWRAVPADKYDPERHQFRVATVAENKANLNRIVELIRKNRPDAKIIFTVSPIPLVATFRPVSCLSANSVSKAVMRASVDEFLREVEDDNVYYWPSYEIVMDGFSDRWVDDRRHVKEEILDYIMTMFEKAWCSGVKPRYTNAQALIRARAAEGTFPKGFIQAAQGKNVKWLRQIADRLDREFEPGMRALFDTRLKELDIDIS